MKLFRILFIALAIFNLAVIATQAKDMVIKEPPKSLSKYYPPESKQPKWIQQMHKMSTHFSGVFINLKENDFEKFGETNGVFEKALQCYTKMRRVKRNLE